MLKTVSVRIRQRSKPSPVLAEQLLAMFEAVVSETHHRGTGKPGAVPRAGVRELVRKDQIVLADQRRDHADIRQISAAEDQGSLGPLELGELIFERRVQRVRPGDESRSARPGTETFQRVACRCDHSRMVRQPEVVVATERNVFLALTANARAARFARFPSPIGPAIAAPPARAAARTTSTSAGMG